MINFKHLNLRMYIKIFIGFPKKIEIECGTSKLVDASKKWNEDYKCQLRCHRERKQTHKQKIKQVGRK